MPRPDRLVFAIALLSLAGFACNASRPGDPRPQPAAGGPDGTLVPGAARGPVVERGPAPEPVVERRPAAEPAIERGPAVEPAIERGPAPELPPGDRVRVSDLVAALEQVAVALEREPSVRADFEALRRAHALADDASLYRDYVRVRLVFESARDGGFWQLRWAITDREANSDAIWSQWARLGTWGGEPDRATATAECDELSALFAFLVRRLGVNHVGLFWPTSNHTVAVWKARGEDGKPVRVVVPTSQIFLGEGESLGTASFDPRRQKTIYDYGRNDAPGDATLPAELARFFVRRSWAEALRPHAELQRARNERSRALGGS